MSMIDGLMKQLELRGLRVEYRPDTDGLALIGPAAERTPQVMAALKAFRPQILDRLRPRDLALPRHDVHHAPPPKEPGVYGEVECVRCQATVWDAEETAGLCDRTACPFKGGRHG
jgi:hypothetical protein